MDRFQAAVEEALGSIPDEFWPWMENTQFVIEERSREGLMGLYEGATALEAGEGFPERVTIFKQPHEQAAATWEDLVEEVRRTILHEVGHHFGMDELDLPY
jgi:predicted Zn-dependent protease with MMP-like domain